MKNKFILILCLCVSVIIPITNTIAGTNKPNFIIILTDDLGYGDFSCYGATDIATPNIDKMAKEGVKLNSFYVSPVCSPSRASIMTGCYPNRVGITGVLFERNNHGLSPKEITVAELLKEQGYSTAIIGKWHLGFLPHQSPTKQGFDYWYGTVTSNNAVFNPKNRKFAANCVYREGLTAASIMNETKVRCELTENDEIIEAPANQPLFTKRYTEKTIKYIKEHKKDPFFIYLAHNMPHIPIYASENFIGTSKRGEYGDAVQELDWGIGEIFKALKEEGLDKNTFVLLTSDNGPSIPHGGKAGLLRGGKGSTFEGGTRVPCIVRWPGKIPANTVCDYQTTIMDILPTLTKLSGGSLPQDRTIDGKDIWPLLTDVGNKDAAHEAVYYFRGSQLKGIREGDWKYEIIHEKDMLTDYKLPKEDEEGLSNGEKKELIKKRIKEIMGDQKKQEALYHLRDDIGESNNIINDNPQIAKELQEKMRAFNEEIKKNARKPQAQKDGI